MWSAGMTSISASGSCWVSSSAATAAAGAVLLPMGSTTSVPKATSS
jgi:hypothetical protein